MSKRLSLPLGKDLDVHMMCNSDHIGEKRTHCSRTGFLIFCNMASIDWVSKKQATIETSVFGAKFVAMKHDIEKLRGLCYKLHMIGIPLTSPSFIHGDNKSQVTNSSKPESTLKKKCNSICYQAVRESVASSHTPSRNHPFPLHCCLHHRCLHHQYRYQQEEPPEKLFCLHHYWYCYWGWIQEQCYPFQLSSGQSSEKAFIIQVILWCVYCYHGFVW